MRVYDITLAVAGVAATAATLALSALPESTSLFSFKKNLQSTEALSVDFEFSKWAAEFNKQYDTIEEYEHRLEQFKRKFYEVRMLNSMNSEATFGLNQFSDLTEEEYKGMLGLKIDSAMENMEIEYLNTGMVPNGGIDWRASGKVTPVKNQGGCGSCWAFSAVAPMESRHAIKTGQLIRLSEQEVVDCSTHNGGCNGGSQGSAWGDMIALGGINTESSYPYTAKQGTCKFNKNTVAAKPTSYKGIGRNDPAQIKAALSAGPVSISLSAGNSAFGSYKTGIWNGAGCGTHIDHGVTAVGWGTQNGQDFFILKNSWGTSWGDQGYIRLASLPNEGACGMNMYPAQVFM